MPHVVANLPCTYVADWLSWCADDAKEQEMQRKIAEANAEAKAKQASRTRPGGRPTG